MIQEELTLPLLSEEANRLLSPNSPSSTGWISTTTTQQTQWTQRRHKNNPNERYQPVKFKNGGKNGDVEVDLESPTIIKQDDLGKEDGEETSD